MKTGLHWGNVSDTLLIPLYCRAKETKHKNPIVSDTKAVEIMDSLKTYLGESKAKELIVRLREVFPGSELLVEMARKYWVKKMNSAYIKWKFKHQLGFSEDSMFSYGIDSAFDIESLCEGIRFIGQWSYFDEREPRLGWMNLFRRFDYFRKVQWTLHFKLG